MRFIEVFVGVLVGVLLLPLFMQLWENFILPMTSGITNPHVQLFFTIAPYAVVVVIVIALFLVVRGRSER